MILKVSCCRLTSLRSALVRHAVAPALSLAPPFADEHQKAARVRFRCRLRPVLLGCGCGATDTAARSPLRAPGDTRRRGNRNNVEERPRPAASPALYRCSDGAQSICRLGARHGASASQDRHRTSRRSGHCPVAPRAGELLAHGAGEGDVPCGATSPIGGRQSAVLCAALLSTHLAPIHASRDRGGWRWHSEGLHSTTGRAPPGERPPFVQRRGEQLPSHEAPTPRRQGLALSL
jgi:hypothetical protein